jgi:hypothetical protein
MKLAPLVLFVGDMSEVARNIILANAIAPVAGILLSWLQAEGEHAPYRLLTA